MLFVCSGIYRKCSCLCFISKFLGKFLNNRFIFYHSPPREKNNSFSFIQWFIFMLFWHIFFIIYVYVYISYLICFERMFVSWKVSCIFLLFDSMQIFPYSIYCFLFFLFFLIFHSIN